jgi:hypothetical protein
MEVLTRIPFPLRYPTEKPYQGTPVIAICLPDAMQRFVMGPLTDYVSRGIVIMKPKRA